ncbi:hypothetical protein ACFUJR_34510 [Streptomyces sp. NPDC057271]|uniref:hypothetical protein n=1 Tax=unclassified Streptomyces TaxID=2593676 RepID=UPI00363C54FE
MHATRTTARFLVGAAIAALSGCVSVAPPPASPPPPPESGSPAPHVGVAPQIVEGPAREALEAALPAPPPSPRATPGNPRESGEQNGTRVRKGTGTSQRQPSAPREQRRAKPPRPPEVPEPPRSRADVCRLGAQYGGWHPESVQSKICKDVYAR